MKNKIKVAILFGGKSAEHEISLISAQHIIKSLDPEKYLPVLIGIDQEGKWYYQADSLQLFRTDDPKLIYLEDKSKAVYFSQISDDHAIVSVDGADLIEKVDVIFPVLHGTYGEDGAIQGFAKLANLPCVGPGILGSAIGMDKEVMKRLLSFAGIPNARFISLRRSQKFQLSYQEASAKLGSEMFVKPANMGSSVGVSFVKSESDFQQAINEAFSYDHKIIIEERIVGREVECAILGNENPKASIAGEVIPKDGFYSYESKYIDDKGAILEVPAKVTSVELQRIQQLAIDTFLILECEGMARVDMFLTPDGELYINEINTIPGFTKISMYPTLWRHSGIDSEDLVDQLIQFAIEKHISLNELKVKKD